MDLVECLHGAFACLTNPDLGEVREIMAGLRPSLEEVSPYLEDPGERPYGSKKLFGTPYLEGFVFNWAAQKKCALHDHGASWAVVCVTVGAAFHGIYSLSRKSVPVLRKEKIEHQGKVVCVPRGVPHVMGNTSNAPLVTLNIYGPPIVDMKVYDPQKCEACIVKRRRGAGAWLPTQPEQILRVIRLGEHTDDARSELDSTLPAQPECPLSDSACGLRSG
jgi:cysteine dioxygenase